MIEARSRHLLVGKISIVDFLDQAPFILLVQGQGRYCGDNFPGRRFGLRHAPLPASGHDLPSEKAEPFDSFPSCEGKGS